MMQRRVLSVFNFPQYYEGMLAFELGKECAPLGEYFFVKLHTSFTAGHLKPREGP
jgi:hypothetical protein